MVKQWYCNRWFGWNDVQRQQFFDMHQIVGLAGRLRRFRASLAHSPQQQVMCQSWHTSQSLSFEQYVALEVREVKLRIAELASSLDDKGTTHRASSRKHRGLQALEMRLKALDQSQKQLVSNGFSALYLDLCQLYQQNRRLGNTKISDFMKKVISEYRSLLRISYAFKEIQMRELSHQEWRSYIDQTVSSGRLRQLLMEEVKQKEDTEEQRYQLCRMCSQQVKLSQIKEHVLQCRKTHMLLQRMEEIGTKIQEVIEEVKNRIKGLMGKAQKTEAEERLVRIGKVLLTLDFKNNKAKDRRCSLINGKSEAKMQDKIKAEIDLYLSEFDDDASLRELFEILREKNMLEKRMANVSSKSPNMEKPKKNDKPLSIKCLAEALKSGWELGSEDKGSYFEENKENSPTKNAASIAKIETMSRKVINQTSLAEIDNIKMYSSLHELCRKDEEHQPISTAGFEILKVLGQGAFGKVYLAKRKITNDIYALKAIKVNDEDPQQLESIRNEHQIFRKIGGDHLVKAPFSFSEKSGHIFVLEYMCGGDLRALLDEEVYFEEEAAKFYLAQMILAIEHLHRFGIIHRDLKPENIVIDKDGHIKLTDFGLSEIQMKEKLQKSREMEENSRKKGSQRRARRAGIVTESKKKLIGTPDYIAPQIINGVSWSNYSIDWWSMGVIAYEFMIGTRPFCADSIEEVISNITNFTIEWPEVGYEEGMISPQAKDLIDSLLDRNYVERLGAEGVSQIKEHQFFKGVNWQNVKSSKPFHIPKFNHLQYLQMSNNPDLRKDLNNFISNPEKKHCKTAVLNNFVRFDLLERETLMQSQVAQESKAKTLKRLQTMKCVELQ